MIDLTLLRENPDAIRASQRSRGADESLVDQAIELDLVRRELLQKFEALRAEQNVFGKQVAAAPKEEKKALVDQAQELAARTKEASAEADAAGVRLNEVLYKIDNVVVEGVPSGGEDDFLLVREVGQKPEFDFEPK
ncbi:MAG: serine--tRNA ligase, partial [Aquiluna sp.]